MSGTLSSKLHACPLFAGLELSQVEQLLESVRYTVREYEPGEVVMLRGDEYESLAILASGSVSAEMQSIAGKTMRMETLRAPEMLASAVLFAMRNRSPVTVTAASRCEVVSFPRETVLSLCASYRQVLTALLRDAGNRVVFLAERMRLSQFASIRQKLASYLLDRAREQHRENPAEGTVVRLDLNRRQIAELFGVTRPALSRVFAELLDRGLIAAENHETVTLRRCDDLQELAEEWE